jgi:uncharacterized protein (DUF736 family)
MAIQTDDSLLQAALIGYRQQANELDGKIAALRQRLGTKAPRTQAAAPTANPKHRISAEGRARIAAAQRKRWAAAKKQQVGSRVRSAAE